ncbi:MAG: hypothetical protein ABI024_13990, partial [Vicinamibacterales bacterium]
GWRNLGDAYTRMGKREEAGHAYQTAVQRVEADLAVNPTSAPTIASLAVYLVKAGRASDGRAKISQALALAPDDVQVRYRAAVVNALTGRREEALKEIAAAIERGYSVRAVRDEEDFDSLHKFPSFQKLISEAAH